MKFTSISKPAEERPKYRCPCCRSLTLCGRGGPNGTLSLSEARVNINVGPNIQAHEAITDVYMLLLPRGHRSPLPRIVH